MTDHIHPSDKADGFDAEVVRAAIRLLEVYYPKRLMPPGPDRDALYAFHDALAAQPGGSDNG